MKFTQQRTHLSLTLDDLNDIKIIQESGYPAVAPIKGITFDPERRITTRIDAIRFALRYASMIITKQQQGTTHVS